MSGPAPWWAEAGLRFRCRRCGACCRGEPGYVWLAPGEEEALAARLEVEPEAFRRQFTRAVGARRTLRERPGGDCVLWDSAQGCLAYLVRPRQCRTFPFWPELLESLAAWREQGRSCPGIGQGPVRAPEEIRRLLAGEDGGKTAGQA